MRLLVALTAFVCCCLPSLRAQEVFLTGETITLPSLGNGAADHATVAANSYGDVVVANHADAPGGVKLVEAVAIASLGQDTFKSGATLLLGDPGLNLMGQDTCRKPDVVALADESFIVVWPRNDVQLTGGARLEAARIHLRDSSGDLLAHPIVDLAAPGEGFVLDPNLVSGDAGVMPDLVAFRDPFGESVAAVYAHEVTTTVGPTGKTFREYELRCVVADWSRPPQSSQFLDGPYVLRDAIPIDQDPTNPFNGGMVLPDVVLDDSGNLVVAHEQSLLAPHFGWAGPARRRILVERFQGLGQASPFSPMDTWPIAVGNATHRPRRPMISSSPEDQEDSISLTWGKQSLIGGDNALGYQMIRLPSTGGGVQPRDAHWIDDPLNEDGLPVTADNGIMRSCFAIRNFPARRSILASVTLGNGNASIVDIDVPVVFPWRPAAQLIATETAGGQVRTYAALCFEGADVLDPDQYRIHFTYRFW